MESGLTVKRIERLKEKGRYADGGGLYLQVSESGSKSWVFKFERTIRDGNGQPKRKETCWASAGSPRLASRRPVSGRACCGSSSRTASIRLRPSARKGRA